MQQPLKILYICTHNRCRSILSEAVTNQKSDGKIAARSAGSSPAGEVHPLSLKYLKDTGYATEGLRSQSWDDFENFNPDVVITVCDQAASEPCPVWFGNHIQRHWSLVDPSKNQGSEDEIAAAFLATIKEIERRVDALLEISFEDMSKEQFSESLSSIIGS